MKKSYFSKRNIPNILTITRMLFIPLILIFMSVDSWGELYSFTVIGADNPSWQLYTNVSINYFVAGILFVIASFTDWLDGYISRKYHYVSDFGKIFDPIADKILINSVLVCLAFLRIIPWYYVVIMFIRDTIVDGFRMYLSSNKFVLPAKKGGKIKTVLQMIALILIFFVFNDSTGSYNLGFYWIQNLVLFFALIASIWSGITYTMIFIVFFRTKSKVQNVKDTIKENLTSELNDLQDQLKKATKAKFKEKHLDTEDDDGSNKPS